MTPSLPVERGDYWFSQHPRAWKYDLSLTGIDVSSFVQWNFYSWQMTVTVCRQSLCKVENRPDFNDCTEVRKAHKLKLDRNKPAHQLLYFSFHQWKNAMWLKGQMRDLKCDFFYFFFHFSNLTQFSSLISGAVAPAGNNTQPFCNQRPAVSPRRSKGLWENQVLHVNDEDNIQMVLCVGWMSIDILDSSTVGSLYLLPLTC